MAARTAAEPLRPAPSAAWSSASVEYPFELGASKHEPESVSAERGGRGENGFGEERNGQPAMPGTIDPGWMADVNARAAPGPAGSVNVKPVRPPIHEPPPPERGQPAQGGAIEDVPIPQAVSFPWTEQAPFDSRRPQNIDIFI